jgi:quinoprotein glucose dehydrogenase
MPMSIPYPHVMALCLVLGSLCLSCTEKTGNNRILNLNTWEIYRGTADAQQFSDLDQINKDNVHLLEPAWIFRTGGNSERSPMECNPIIVGNTMYLTSASLDLIAVNASDGEAIWRFEADEKITGVNRGVTYFDDGDGGRIFFSVGYYLYAINAETGQVITDFGNEGRIDMRENLGKDPESLSVTLTSPATVFEDLLIVGSATGEGYDASPGHIRAYDAYSGEMAWIFHTIPREGEEGYDSWDWIEGENYGGANNWGGLSIDREKGWVYVALGSPVYDFYGANRKGANLYGNCVVALDARSGRKQWHYQTVKHDVWDYDLPAAPTLIDLTIGGDVVNALVQPTKMGELILLDRYTGRPLGNPKEISVPASTVPGEEAFPTQTVNQGILVVRQGFDSTEVTNISIEAEEYVKREMQQYINGGMYVPPSLQGTLTMPATRGGVLWGGLSYDRHNNMIFVNANEIPMILQMRKVEEAIAEEGISGYAIYMSNCASCHGSDKEGDKDSYPSLNDIDKKLNDSTIIAIIQKGKGLMPAFAQLDKEETDALVEFLKKPSADPVHDIQPSAKKLDRYVLNGYRLFTDQEGFPASRPPWGTLNAVDLSTMQVKWKVPLGSYPELKERGIADTGTQNFGGCVATAGGLVFIGGSADEMFRAFDADTGEVLWEYKLSAGGYAMPAVYQVDGKQYVVIAAGGGNRLGTPTGDAFYAFALPD